MENQDIKKDKTDQKEKSKCAQVALYAGFGITVIAACVYTAEKTKRFAEIVLEEANAESIMDNKLAGSITGPIETVSSIFSYISHLLNFFKYAAPIHKYLWESEDKVLCCTVKQVSPYIVYFPFSILVLGMARLALQVFTKGNYYVNFAKSKHKNWKKPINILTKSFDFASGVYMLATIIKNPDAKEGRVLFILCSIVDSLTAPLDFYGIDNLVFKADKQGYTYAGVYGLKSAVKIGKSVGYLNAKE